MGQGQKNQNIEFIWRIASSHTIAYFIAGIFAMLFMNYKEEFAGEVLSVIMRPVESPWVALGAGLQIFRGAILALIFLPFKDTLLSKNGLLKIILLILGLSYFSTIGPGFGSFEGYLYTTIPIHYHLLGLPEALIYTFLFSFIIVFWYRNQSKVYHVVSIVLVSLIVIMSLLGWLASLGLIES